jgi:hypothetical protein
MEIAAKYLFGTSDIRFTTVDEWEEEYLLGMG